MNRSVHKLTIALAAAALSSATVSAQQYTKEQLAQQRRVYLEAVQEFKAGKLDSAEAKAKAVYRLRPSDPYVRQLLTQIQSKRREIARQSPWERTLKSTVVPLVDIDEASLDEVLDFIRAKAVEITGKEEAAPSFVIKSKDAGDRIVSFRLRNVPLMEVLRLAGDIADVRFSFERYAVVGHDMRPAVAEKEPGDKSPAGESELEAGGGGFPQVLNLRVPDDLDPFLPSE